MSPRDTLVVLGAGPLGLAVMRELLRRGKRVRVVSRSGSAPVPQGVEVMAAEVTDSAQAIRAFHDAAVVFHCAAPPYARMAQQIRPLMEHVIAAAAAANAILVYGDDLYAYGPASGPLTEDLPYRAPGPHGQGRAEAATALMEAHRDGTVRATIGRASDFFGPHVMERSLVGTRVFMPALRGKAAQYVGNPDPPHTYTFIDDFARGLVTLGERGEALGQVWHVPSGETVSTREFVRMVFEEAGTAMRLSTVPEAVVTLLGLVNPTMRSLAEQAYQRREPFVMDHSKFARTFGASPTPNREAIRQSLAWYRSYVADGRRSH